MEKQEVSPHKWAKEIIAWANGAKIECRLRDSDVWTLESNPSWFEDVEYRVYDPLIEVREAFDRGETIQGRLGNFSIWNDYSNSFTTVTGESIKDSNGWKWRVKPDNELEVGKDYIHNDGDWLVIDRKGNERNSGFTDNGYYYSSICCSSPKNWIEATKEQVISSFKKHLIERYGGDWKNVKIKECMYQNDDYTNEGLNSVDIDKYSGVWKVWNKNGCLFNGKEWAEVLEEENQYVPFEEEDKEQFRGKWIKRKEGNLEMKITRFETLSTNTFLIERRSPKQLLEDFTFIDGTPFGKIEQ